MVICKSIKMKRILFLMCLLILSFASVDKSKCYSNGKSFNYYESINILTLEDNISFTSRQIVTNGCPNHFNSCQRDTCTGFAPKSEESYVHKKTINIPAFPVFSNIGFIDLNCDYGSVGTALNGVSIYSVQSKAGTGSSKCHNALLNEGATFDQCSGHADPESHEYHYHIAPSCLLKQLNYTGFSHSPQIGWSYDGFPIYGPTGPYGIAMVKCGECGSHNKYCLDECNGLEGDLSGTDGYDSFLYRYYMPGDVANTHCSKYIAGGGECNGLSKCCVSQLPAPLYYPYSIGCYRGCLFGDKECWESSSASSSSTSTGTVNGYSPSLSNYPKTIFEDSETTEEEDSATFSPILSSSLVCNLSIDSSHGNKNYDNIGTTGTILKPKGSDTKNSIYVMATLSIFMFCFCGLAGFILQILVFADKIPPFGRRSDNRSNHNKSTGKPHRNWYYFYHSGHSNSNNSSAGGSGHSSASCIPCYDFDEDGDGDGDGIDMSLNGASIRSGGSSDSAGMTIDDLVVDFHDNNNTSSIFASCISNSSTSSTSSTTDHHQHHSLYSVAASSLFPCIDRPKAYGREEEEEDGDDTPWAI